MEKVLTEICQVLRYIVTRHVPKLKYKLTLYFFYLSYSLSRKKIFVKTLLPLSILILISSCVLSSKGMTIPTVWKGNNVRVILLYFHCSYCYVKPGDLLKINYFLHFRYLWCKRPYSRPAIFAHAKGLMGKEQCHMVSQGANKW